MWEGVIGKEIPKREKKERERREKRKSGRGEKKRILIWEAEEGRERQKNLCVRSSTSIVVYSTGYTSGDYSMGTE